jgi:hypothetical protein
MPGASASRRAACAVSPERKCPLGPRRERRHPLLATGDREHPLLATGDREHPLRLRELTVLIRVQPLPSVRQPARGAPNGLQRYARPSW